MYLAIACVLFALYFGNVSLGAFGGAPVLDDLGEMLLLFVAVIFFVIAILRREAARKDKINTPR